MCQHATVDPCRAIEVHTEARAEFNAVVAIHERESVGGGEWEW